MSAILTSFALDRVSARSVLRSVNRREFAGVVTLAALDAAILVDRVGGARFAADTGHRTPPGAECTTHALIHIDLESEQGLALVRRTAPLFNVRHEFLMEIIQRAQYGIGCRLTQATKAGALDQAA
jgi:hypothetical protein